MAIPNRPPAAMALAVTPDGKGTFSGVVDTFWLPCPRAPRLPSPHAYTFPSEPSARLKFVSSGDGGGRHPGGEDHRDGGVFVGLRPVARADHTRCTPRRRGCRWSPGPSCGRPRQLPRRERHRAAGKPGRASRKSSWCHCRADRRCRDPTHTASRWIRLRDCGLRPPHRRWASHPLGGRPPSGRRRQSWCRFPVPRRCCRQRRRGLLCPPLWPRMRPRVVTASGAAIISTASAALIERRLRRPPTCPTESCPVLLTPFVIASPPLAPRDRHFRIQLQPAAARYDST